MCDTLPTCLSNGELMTRRQTHVPHETGIPIPITGAPWGAFETYKLCVTERLPIQQWFPGVNIIYELLDQPISPSQLNNIWTTFALVVALLLNVMIAVPLSLDYDRLQAANEMFGPGGENYHVFKAYSGSYFEPSMKEMGEFYSNRILNQYSICTAFLSAALILIVLSAIIFGSMHFDEWSDAGAYRDWWKNCGRWILLIQMGLSIYGILATYLFFFILVDITFPNAWWESGGEPLPRFPDGISHRLDSSASNAGIQVLVFACSLTIPAALFSYGIARRYLMRHFYHTRLHACDSQRAHEENPLADEAARHPAPPPSRASANEGSLDT